MKRLSLLICLSLCLSAASAQKKPVEKPAADTGKLKQPAAPQADFFLVGKFNWFELLYSAVTRPKDVTPNQQEALAKWLREGVIQIKTDTVPPVKK